MSRVNLLNRRDVPELEPVLAAAENRMGFVPNSQLVMVYKPKLLQAFTQLGQAVHNPANKTSRQLRMLSPIWRVSQRVASTASHIQEKAHTTRVSRIRRSLLSGNMRRALSSNANAPCCTLPSARRLCPMP